MILTDEELRAAYMAALLTSRETSMARCERDALRGVEDAVVERLIAECDRMHTGVTTYKQRLMGEMAGDWLRSTRGEGDE